MITEEIQYGEGKALRYFCPGCNSIHIIRYEYPSPPIWQYNGNATAPTLSPSIKITYEGADAGVKNGEYIAPPACCHHFVRNGFIEYCSDSTHSYRGKTIPLPDIPPEYM